jgi:hypothetical protein
LLTRSAWRSRQRQFAKMRSPCSEPGAFHACSILGLLCSKKVQPLGVRFMARLIAGNISLHRSSHAPKSLQGDLEDAATESAFRNAPANSPLRGHTSSVAEGGQGWQARREDTVTPRLLASSSGFCKTRRATLRSGYWVRSQLAAFGYLPRLLCLQLVPV